MKMKTNILIIFSIVAFFASQIDTGSVDTGSINNSSILVDSSCDSGWTYYSGNCFKVFKFSRNGLEAQQSCISEGGNLIKIVDDTQWYWMQFFIRNNSLLGGPNIWVGGYSAYYMQFYWLSDGSSIPLNTNWWCNSTATLKTEPNNIGGSQYLINENCVGTLKDKGSDCLADSPCSTSQYYWCQKLAVGTTTPIPTTCSSGWIGYNGHCYQAFRNPYLNGFAAQQACISNYSAYLMKIDDSNEFNWAVSSLWKTFQTNGFGSSMWLGGYSFYPYKYYWTADNTTLSRHSSWWYGNSEPSNSGGSYYVVGENCICTWYAGNSDAGLNDYPCSSTLAYICEKSA